MRILGIDPGLATIGLGLIDSDSPSDLRVIDWLTITTPAGLPLSDRLHEIHKDLSQFLDDVKPELVVIEKLFFATNARTAIDVAQARGVIMLCAAQRAIPLLEATPLQMKLGITGDGQADKQQVQTMLVHMLKLAEIPRPDDAADALALAAYGAMQQHSLSLLAEQS
jgi:crossover junction endodeoxyribonuclease RuvC